MERWAYGKWMGGQHEYYMRIGIWWFSLHFRFLRHETSPELAISVIVIIAVAAHKYAIFMCDVAGLAEWKKPFEKHVPPKKLQSVINSWLLSTHTSLDVHALWSMPNESFWLHNFFLLSHPTLNCIYNNFNYYLLSLRGFMRATRAVNQIQRSPENLRDPPNKNGNFIRRTHAWGFLMR